MSLALWQMRRLFFDQRSITMVSTSASGQQSNGWSYGGSVSADGRCDVEKPLQAILVANDTNNTDDVFLRDTQTGAISLVSTGENGQGNNGLAQLCCLWCAPMGVMWCLIALQAIWWQAIITELWDVFLQKTCKRRDLRLTVSTGANRLRVNGWSYGGSVSADGRYVVFSSSASDLVAGDNKRTERCFSRRYANRGD
jgi:hypothetical protein